MSVPVLMYHHVLPESGFIASSIEQFEEQMKLLHAKGYRTLTSDEFSSYKKNNIKLPAKSVFITFDDGWRDNYIYAYPVLKKYNLKATLFLVTEWVEKASSSVKSSFFPLGHNDAKHRVAADPSAVILNWDDIEKMSDVFDFHSHTHSHRDNYFGQYSWDEEFEISMDIIKSRLGYVSRHLCWPRGKYDKALEQKAGKCGYEMLYTTKRGINLPDMNTKELKRLSVKKSAKWLNRQLIIFSSSFAGYIYSLIKN